MKIETLYTTISIIIFSGLFYLFYKVLSPFLGPIVWAMVLSITFYPVFRLFEKLIKRPWAASLITLFIILIIILGPFTFIVKSLVNEITETYSIVENKGFEIITKIQGSPTFSRLLEKFSAYTNETNIDLNEAAVKSLKTIGKYIGENISKLFKNIAVFAVSFIIMCLTIFYFLKDGKALLNYIQERIPLVEEQKKQIQKRVKEMIIAAIYGGLAVGVTQGTLGGIAFFFLGLHAPVFWGSAMAIFSLVPLFGSFTIWGPASIILIVSGSYAKGIGLFLYGVLVISTIDNILKPLIIGGRTKLHMLLIFFSVLGGIKYFGFIGFILGPLITVLCLSLLEIYAIKPSEQEN
jgi:predicted PurR-regulated permease PerM